MGSVIGDALCGWYAATMTGTMTIAYVILNNQHRSDRLLAQSRVPVQASIEYVSAVCGVDVVTSIVASIFLLLQTK